MLSRSIPSRSTFAPLRLAPVARRLNSTTSAASSSRPAAKGQGLNQPKAIFWGWAGLVVIAGFGYFTVKSNNTAKKRDFMIRQGQEQQRLNAGAENGEGGATSSPGPVLMSASKQEKYAQSPLQSLVGAFNRQTTQRSRRDSSEGGRDGS